MLVKCRPQHKNPKKGLPNSQTPRSGTLIRVLMLRPFSTSSGKEKKSKLSETQKWGFGAFLDVKKQRSEFSQCDLAPPFWHFFRKIATEYFWEFWGRIFFFNIFSKRIKKLERVKSGDFWKRPSHKNPKKGLPNSWRSKAGTLIRVLMLRPEL